MSEGGVDTGAQLSKKDIENAINKGGPELPIGVVEGSDGKGAIDNDALAAAEVMNLDKALAGLSWKSSGDERFKKSKEVGPSKPDIKSLSATYFRSLGDKPKG